jgi:hypothetical protein
MKWTLYLLGVVLSLSALTITYAGAQDSIADLARQQRQAKRPSAAKVYTNEDFAPVTINAASDKAESAAKTDKKEDAAKADGNAKQAADIKAKADEQRKNIAQLERELDVAQREYRLKVAVYYADVGNNLRDSKKWSEDDRKQRAELDEKQKALNDAKQKLSDIEEEARKAGVRVE